MRRRRVADTETMVAHLRWSGSLALVSLVAPAVGVVLMLHSAGTLAGLALILAGIPLAVAAWIALGAPVTRRGIRREPKRH